LFNPKGAQFVSIDGCKFTYIELANGVLPDYMTKMRAAMKNPHSMTDFSTPGIGVTSILKRLEQSEDFPGCYVLLHNGAAFYVGISRRLVARLQDHVKGDSHHKASLAYLMACRKVQHELTRADAMKDQAFQHAFKEARTFLCTSSVAFIVIDNPLERYLFEAYCAMQLDTSRWNTFDTH
jgi:predicted GIY-YIG superfamily endonuclease